MLGQPIEKGEKGRVVLPGTVGALIASYMASAAYVRLRATTKVGMRAGSPAFRTSTVIDLFRA